MSERHAAQLDSTAPVRSGEQLDLERLGDYLHAALPDVCGELAIEQFPAGHSNLTYCVRVGGEQFVLRRPPFGSKVKSAHDMGREYRILSRLHKVYPLAPEPLFYCDDEQVLGAPFYVMRRIRGIVLRNDLPPGLEMSPPEVTRLHEAFIDNLARLHAVDYEAAGLGDLGRPAGYIQRQVDGWAKRYVGSQTHDIAEMDRIIAWLQNDVPAEVAAVLIHNDYKLDNVVLDADDPTRLVGELDWEMSTLGDPLMDLGVALSYWIDPDDPDEIQAVRWGPTTVPGSLTRQQLADRYAATTGLDVGNIAWYVAFGLFKVAVITQQIYYRFHVGKTQDERFKRFLDVTRLLARAACRTADAGKV
ncbi:MAG: phosphotransferase family protein [Pirellulales bacterium]